MSSLPHTHRLRFGRYSEPGRIYLLTAVTRNREPIFHDWRIGRLLVKAFRYAQQAASASSLAWVVMPDHFHWLVELHSGDLPRLMQSTKSRSSRAINRARESSAPVWQKGYSDRALRRDEDLKATARYIITNPLRAGLVQRIGDYPLWDAVWL